jgi:hypothetical protein
MSTPADPNSLIWLVMIALILLGGLIFILPTIIAFSRGHVHRWWILLLNFALGGTGVAWFAALIWSLGKIGIPTSNK